MHNIVCIMFFIAGVVSSLTSLYFLLMGFWSRKWPKTKAEITDVRIKNVVLDSSETNYLVVEYSYLVNEKVYSNNRMSYSISPGYSFDFTYLEHKKKEYSIGQTIDIYYNPIFPKKSIIYNGIKISNIFLLVLGTSIILFSFYCSV